MKHNTCPNCGAAMILHDYGWHMWHCDYCGTEVNDAGQIIVHVENPKIRIAASKVAVDKMILELYPEEAEIHAKMNICQRLAEFLFDNDCVDFEEEFDPVLCKQVYHGKFRYVDKGEKL